MNFEEFKKTVDKDLQEAKKNKLLVSYKQKLSLQFVLFLILGVLAFQNGLYGFNSASSVIASIALAVLFFSGDLALAVLNSLNSSKNNAKFAGFIAKCGLIVLSITAGLSFLLSEQLSNDNVDTSLLKTQIIAEQQNLNRLPVTYVTMRNTVGTRLANLQNKYYSIEENQKHSSNGIYVYLSKFFNTSYEVCSLTIKFFWILIFLITSISLSMYTSILWTERDDEKFKTSYLRKIKKQIDFEGKLKAYHNVNYANNTVREIKNIEKVGTDNALKIKREALQKRKAV
jgi:hypothetical protein